MYCHHAFSLAFVCLVNSACLRMTLLESFYLRTEGLPWSRSIPGQNDSPGVVLSQDRMTPLGSLYPRTEGLPWSRFTSTECLPWSRSIPGQKDSPGVVSQALNVFPGVILSQDRMTLLESFHQDGLPWSRSIP